MLIDISVPLSPGLPVWTGENRFTLTHKARMSEGADANVTHLAMGSHTGTHIDAPLHFVDGGETTEEIPLAKLVGPCEVVDFQGLKEITADNLATKFAERKPTGKLLFKTDNSRLWDNPKHEFYLDYCALTAGAAQWCVDNGVHLVAIDYLSIQLYYDPKDTHVILLENEVVIVENVDLREVAEGAYRLICLPLKVEGVEGTLARAVLER